jgi:hypothetical protein
MSGCETGRQRPPHRVHVRLYPAHSSPPIEHPQSTRPVHPVTVNRSESSSSVTCLVVCSSEPCPRAGLSSPSCHVMSCLALSTYVLSTDDDDTTSLTKAVVTIRLIIQSLDVIILHSLFRLVSFPGPQAILPNPSNHLLLPSSASLPGTLSPRASEAYTLFTSPRPVTSTAYAQTPLTHRQHLSSKQSALGKPEKPRCPCRAVRGAKCLVLPVTHPMSAIASAHLAITTASLLFLAIGAANAPSLHLMHPVLHLS